MHVSRRQSAPPLFGDAEAWTRLEDADQPVSNFFSLVQQKAPPNSGGFAFGSAQWKRLVTASVTAYPPTLLGAAQRPLAYP